MNKEYAKSVLGHILSNMSEESLAKTRNRMLIASKIGIAMKSKGLTQKEFAAMMGKTESEISEWLSGDRNFTIDTLTSIEIVLKVNLLDTRIMKYTYTTRIQPSRVVTLNYGDPKEYTMRIGNTEKFSKVCANY